MTGDDQVVELLNEVLTVELTAVNQYFLDAKMLDEWGFPRLGQHFRSESMGEMKDVDELVGRILSLERHPTLQQLGSLRTGETPTRKLSMALELERDVIDRLTRGIVLTFERSDDGTRQLLEEILQGEEAHAVWLEAQLALVSQIGDARYLAQQAER
jgi:bacterioferritin